MMTKKDPDHEVVIGYLCGSFEVIYFPRADS